MALPTPESGYLFARVPLTGSVSFVVVGPAVAYQTHWTGWRGSRGQRAARCQSFDGKLCGLCHLGRGWKMRYMVPVLAAGERRILELGKPQYPWLQMMDELGTWCGARITVRREWAAKNAPLLVEPAGREHVSPEQVFSAAGVAACEGQENYRAWLISTSDDDRLDGFRPSGSGVTVDYAASGADPLR